MPDIVGSVGATLEAWGGAQPVIAHPATATMAAAETVAVDRELAWQTTIGQIIFLQSVVPAPT